MARDGHESLCPFSLRVSYNNNNWDAKVQIRNVTLLIDYIPPLLVQCKTHCSLDANAMGDLAPSILFCKTQATFKNRKQMLASFLSVFYLLIISWESAKHLCWKALIWKYFTAMGYVTYQNKAKNSRISTGYAYAIPSEKLQFCIFTTLCILALFTEKYT